MTAVRYGQVEKVREMVEKEGYDVCMVGDEGYTALHVAIERNQVAMIEFLMKAGACVFAKNAAGVTPYAMAKKAGGAVYAAIHSDGYELRQGDCAVCMEFASLYTLPCGDAACVQCIRNWFVSLLDENEPIRCPAAECLDEQTRVVPSHIDIEKLLTREEFARWDHAELTRTLLRWPQFQFCTECTGGGFIVEACPEVACVNCSARWCRDCRLQTHGALSCDEFRERFHADLAAATKVIESTCKRCPTCKNWIERNGGCSHMTCRQCRFEFCWWCMGKYTGTYTMEEDGTCPCGSNTAA